MTKKYELCKTPNGIRITEIVLSRGFKTSINGLDKKIIKKNNQKL